MLMHKRCPNCRKIKPASDFWKNTTTRSGLESRCKECKKIYQRSRPDIFTPSKLRWAKGHPERHKYTQIKWKVKNGKASPEALALWSTRKRIDGVWVIPHTK